MKNPLDILIIEDCADLQRLMTVGFKSLGKKTRLHFLSDGVSALLYLRREKEYQNAEPPGLVILDLNIPGRTGKEVLREIKGDPTLRWIPVIVFSGSESEKDIRDCYALHANCYVRKPVQLEDFLGVVKQVEHFWCEVVTLPPRK